MLAVEAFEPTPALDPPAALGPFLVARGGDIKLRYREAAPRPVAGEALFDSGGVWRVDRAGRRLVYSFRVRKRRPPLYKQVSIDAALERGTLVFDRRACGPRFALDYPLDELLFQHRLALEGGVELHGCGVVWRGRALVFCGRSGAGKSTTARLWRRHAPEARLLSDDRVVLRPSRSGMRAWGTPWHGDGGFASPGAAPLGALFFLRHARATRITSLAPAEAAARLFTRSFPPTWDREGVARTLDACAEAASRAPAFELAFRPDRGVVAAVQDRLEREGLTLRRPDPRRAAPLAGLPGRRINRPD